MEAPLEEWRHLHAVDREIAVSAAACRWINDAMEAEDYGAIDRALAAVDMSSIGASAALGLAVWSSPVREHLHERTGYIERLTLHLRGEVGNERAWSLMRFAREER